MIFKLLIPIFLGLFLNTPAFATNPAKRHLRQRPKHSITQIQEKPQEKPQSSTVDLSSTATSTEPPLTSAKTILTLYQMMKDVHEVLVLGNIEYWVIGGTLLGAVRHQGIIPWDDDLDICVKATQAKALVALKPILESIGYKLIYLGGIYRLYRIFPQNGLSIPGDKQSKYPFMDIFLFKLDQTKVTYFWTHFAKPRADKDVAIYTNELYPFKDYKFGSFFVRGPNDPFKYLECCYGSDFMKIGYCDHKHMGHHQHLGGTINLNENDYAPAQPVGPLNDNVSKILKH